MRPICPYCHHNERSVKAGFNPGGSQRYRCQACRRYFTPQPDPQGYAENLHHQALRLYLEGTSFRAIGRLLKLNHQTVANWIKAEAEHLPTSVTDQSATETIEIDELFTFLGAKKKKST